MYSIYGGPLWTRSNDYRGLWIIAKLLPFSQIGEKHVLFGG
ncbi:MAG: hypothetical protein ACI9TZ_000303 [Yoonia sp.]